MQRHGWPLLIHGCLIDQLRNLHRAVERTQRRDTAGSASNANVKLFQTLSRLMPVVIPQDPSRAEYRQGNTFGPQRRRRRRAKVGRGFRLFFRFDTKAKVIVYVWVNDQSTLRSTGSRTDPYTVFAKMLAQGNPPGDWAALMTASKEGWQIAVPHI